MARTGTLKVTVSRWTPDGIVFDEVTFDKCIGATISDGDANVSYDYETGGVTLSKGDGRDVPVKPDLLAKEAV